MIVIVGNRIGPHGTEVSVNFREPKGRLVKYPKVRKEYEKLGPEFQLAQSLIRARLKKGWTQAELARRVGMQQPNIARLEGGNYDRVSLPTLKKVARGLGAEIQIKLSA
ncbi:MAG: helix-turn-helix domain-containing protein [Candidatus Binatia bacterium]